MPLSLTSTTFGHLGEIPTRCTCEGKNLAPALAWSGLPAGTRSLALIVDDPDAPDPAAPRMTYVHWVLYNIPTTCTGLPEGVLTAELPAGTREGLNDSKRTGYGGPCPPIGRHRYFHKLYALDTCSRTSARRPSPRSWRPWPGTSSAASELMGTYQKKGAGTAMTGGNGR